MSATIRAGCRGIIPLDARLEPWAEALCDQPALVEALLAEHGSPVNVLEPSVLARNAGEFRAAATDRGVELELFFARKANKALSLVDAARQAGLGIDLASEPELGQCLARDVPGHALMMTAAIKSRSLLERCLGAGVTIAVDNHDELDRLRELAVASGERASVALRLAPRLDRPHTRFGFTADAACSVGKHMTGEEAVGLDGVHFHLDGYDAPDRVRALDQALGIIDVLRAQGHPVRFADIGGGAPMSYLDSADQWESFWEGFHAALRGETQPLTFEGHPLGLRVCDGQVSGAPAVYPAHQRPVRGEWLAAILDAPLAEDTVAGALRRRDLALRMEPGRSLLDGAGLTAATVEFRKQRADGAWLVGLAMNRTQCRSTADDFLVDPLLLRPSGAGAPGPPIEAYLVGAYCIERELLTWRRLRFDQGVAVGDVVVFPNTAGYLMHILESASHQMPLARNLVAAGHAFELDAIDDERREA